MKKFLLLAVYAGFAWSASAGVNVNATKDVDAKADAQLMRSTKETSIQSIEVSAMPVSFKSNSGDVKKSDNKALVVGAYRNEGKLMAAEGDAEGDDNEFESQPYYYLPNGTFFGRTIMDGEDGSYVRRPLFMPGDVDITWRQATVWTGDYPKDKFSWTWNYYNLVETADGLDLDLATEDAYGSDGYPVNLTTNYPMYVSGIPTPAVEFCGTSYGDGTVQMAGGGEAERYLIQSGGYPSGRLASGSYPWSFGNFDFYEFNGWAGNGAVCDTYTDFVFCNYNNYSLNSARIFKDATVLSYATLLNIPDGKQLGVTSVTVNCWVKAIPSSPLKIDFYDMGWADNPDKPGYGWYVPGERIGGGWLNPDELTVDSYNQTVVIPMREGEGDFVSESFVNLTGQVLAIISCDEAADNTINFPIIMMDDDKCTWRSYGYFVLDVQRGTEDENDPLSGKQLYN
ncbi:MAG: hypothetical protein K2M98_00245, partial [Muribaculum sp.]|nr:hypothetical protein [Muribaculum sp.]